MRRNVEQRRIKLNIFKNLPLHDNTKETIKKLTREEVCFVNKKVTEEMRKKITPLRKKYIHSPMKENYFEQSKKESEQIKNGEFLHNIIDKGDKTGRKNKKRTQSMDLIDRCKPSRELKLMEESQFTNQVSKINRTKNISEISTEYPSKIKALCDRANKHLNQRRKILTNRISRGVKETQNEKQRNFRFSDVLQNLHRHKQNIYGYIGPKTKILVSSRAKIQARKENIMNERILRQIQNQSDIDEVDKQFEEGLVQQFYTTKRVQLRKKINRAQWEKRQLNSVRQNLN